MDSHKNFFPVLNFHVPPMEEFILAFTHHFHFLNLFIKQFLKKRSNFPVIFADEPRT